MKKETSQENLQQKVALVTGATGFIGSHLVEKLLKEKYKVRCLIRKTSSLEWLKDLDVDYVYGDICKMESLFEAVDGVDYVYNVAALTKAKTPSEFYMVNHEGTKNLIEICAEYRNLKRFVHISSQAVCGPSRDGRALTEASECNPISDYGKSKLKSEKTILKYKDKLPVTLIRPSAIYGPRDKDMLTLFKIINFGIKPLFSKERNLISLCYVTDLVEGIFLSGEQENAEGKTYFISNEEHYSREEIEDVIAECLNKKAVKIRVPEKISYSIASINASINKLLGRRTILNKQKIREINQKFWICDITKAKEELGHTPKYDLTSGIKETIKWYKENGWL